MEKRLMLGIALAVLLMPLAAAHGGYGYGLHHEDIEEILEEGTYQDLVKYRQSTGLNAMPWIDNEEGFEYARERHEAMEEYGMPCHGGGYGWR